MDRNQEAGRLASACFADTSRAFSFRMATAAFRRLIRRASGFPDLESPYSTVVYSRLPAVWN